jgi:uncharacterized membrane protein YqjE
VKNNAIDPTYKPFETMEKVSVVILTVQEVIISSIYLFETVRILKVGELVQKKSNRRRIQMLFVANIAIICIDVITVSLEFLALWGVWCSFKGFGYSVKLKIEFAILNQLRDSVKQTSNGSSYGHGISDGEGYSLSHRVNKKANSKSHVSALERHTFDELEDRAPIHVTKTTQISVEHDDIKNPAAAVAARGRGLPGHPPSESSSEVEFATKGV